jgi:hypothetical protein
MSCNCSPNNCTCGCQTLDPCSISSCTTACSAGEPCAQTESSCTAEEQDCCTNCNLFVETIQAFNMPACDGEGSMFVDDASRVAVGSILYAEGVGYLEVTAIVDATELTVKNNCPECTKHVLDPGNPVAEGTQFAVGIPFCASEGDVEFLGPMLNSDYFIPAVGLCVLVAVTNVEGLAIGDVVSIDSNRYRINDIPTTTSLEICNDGDGGTPGVFVEKDADGDGILNFPVIRVSSINPCLEPAVDEGKLLVCDGGIQAMMEGTIENQVPAWVPANDQFELRVIQNLAICVTLVCCLTLDPEADECDEYLIDVLPDTDDFDTALNELLPNYLKITIDGDPFCVTEVVDSNTLRVIPAFEVTEIVQYIEGAVVCIAECCEQCVPHIWTMDDSFENNNCEPEILVTTGIVILAAPVGIHTFTFPESIGVLGQTGFEVGAGFMWQLDVENEGCCDCRKYIEISSNFETLMDIDTADVFANVEFRILKLLPAANSQSFAAMPFVSDRTLIVAQPPDLISAAQTINTYKGTAYDRGFIDPDETARWVGHIRIVTENNTMAPVDLGFGASWRVWVKMWNFDCANATVEIDDSYT